MNTMMVPDEEQEPKNSSNGHAPLPCFSAFKSNSVSIGVSPSSSSSSKKNKHKISQRGLGVAQLERLRLEELQTNNAKSLSTPYSQELCPVQQKNISNVTKPDTLSIVSSNLVPSSTMVAVGMDFFDPVQNQALDSSAVVRNCRNGLLPVWKTMAPSKSNSLTSNSYTCNFSQGLQPQMQYANTSMIVESSNRSPEVINTQIEPPSNQNYSSSAYNLLTYWREQNKDREFERDQEVVVGKKRSWPFQVDSVVAQPTFPCKVPKLFNSYIKPEGILPFHGNSIVHSEIPNSTSRSYELYHHARSTRQNDFAVESTIGTALSLAPTTPTVTTTMQGNSVNFSQYNGKTFYSFIPLHEDSYRPSSPEQKGDVVEDIDLSLKL